MRLLPIALGMVVGLALGWAGVKLFARPASESASQGRQLPRAKVERGDPNLRWLDGRDELAPVRTADEFVAARMERVRGSDRSPYRHAEDELGWLEHMAVEEIVTLLERGELHDSAAIALAVDRWVEVDPEGALAALDTLPLNRDNLSLAQGRVYAHWTKTNPLGMIEKLEAMPAGFARENGGRLLVSAWAAQDPARAIESAERLSRLFARPDEQVGRLREQLLSAWLERDEEGAFAWAEGVEDAQVRAELLEALVVARLERTGPGEAVAHILARPEDEALQGKLGDYWRRWVQRSPVEALGRLATLPEGHRFWRREAQELAQRAMTLAHLGWMDPRTMNQFVDDLPEGERRRKVLLGMVQGASSNDLGLAQELLERLPESREREQAAAFMVELWARDDLEAAGDWLRAQQPSASRDLATSRYAVTLAGEEPAQAATWVDAIGRDELRSQARERLYARWREQDPAAADEWRSGWE